MKQETRVTTMKDQRKKEWNKQTIIVAVRGFENKDDFRVVLKNLNSNYGTLIQVDL